MSNTKLLKGVTAPGCPMQILQWVYASERVANQFCSATAAEFALRKAAHPHELPVRMNARELAQGSLSSTGRTLELTRDFQVLERMLVMIVNC